MPGRADRESRASAGSSRCPQGTDTSLPPPASYGDLELALLQMKTETLTRIDTALDQLDAGLYGRCFTCHSEIAKARLRALPFAVRRTCREERRERAQRAMPSLAQTRSSCSRFSGAIGS